MQNAPKRRRLRELQCDDGEQVELHQPGGRPSDAIAEMLEEVMDAPVLGIDPASCPGGFGLPDYGPDCEELFSPAPLSDEEYFLDAFGDAPPAAHPGDAATPVLPEAATDEESEGDAGVAHFPAERWGCFTLSFKRKKGVEWPIKMQASCPFHRKNAKTGCKKTLPRDRSLRPGDQADIAQARRDLKWWCNQAKTHGRQQTHLWAGSEHSIPILVSEEALLAGRIDVAPEPGSVKHDVQLDEEEALFAAKAASADAGPGDELGPELDSSSTAPTSDSDDGP